MKNVFFLMFFFIGFQFTQVAYGQTYTTQSKSCGSCGKAVSNNSQVGMRCPHCGVVWGRENTKTTTTYKKDYSSKYDNYSSGYNDYSSSDGYSSSYSKGYSSRSYNDEYDNREGKIGFTSKKVNLRSSPSTSSSIITKLPPFFKVSIIKRVGAWYYVSYSKYDIYSSHFIEQKGYIHSSLLN